MADIGSVILQVTGSLLNSSPAAFLTTIGVQFGGAAVIGFPIGYALKKAAKLLLEIALVSIGIATGLVCLVIYGLERLGILTVQVNYGQVVVVTEAAGNWVIVEAYVLAPLVTNALTQFTAPTGGFGIGVLLGLKKG